VAAALHAVHGSDAALSAALGVRDDTGQPLGPTTLLRARTTGQVSAATVELLARAVRLTPEALLRGEPSPAGVP
jgi:hypothetical protein